jgi:hypothetical protein
MSTELTPFDFSTIPANLKKKELSATTRSLIQGASQNPIKNIRLHGKDFVLVVDGKEVQKNKSGSMDVVIVRAALSNSRVHFDPSKPFKQGQPASPPNCTSENGVTPDARSTEPQADTCASCLRNVKGSGPNGTRACAYKRKIAIALGGDLEGDVYQLVLPAMSIFSDNGTKSKALMGYATLLAANNLDVHDMVTRMSFDEDSSVPKLQFSPVRHLTADEARIVARQGSTPAALFAVGEKATKLPAIGVSEVTDVVEVVEEDDEVIVAPVAKKAKKAVVEDDSEPVVVTKAAPEDRASKIKNSLAAWGD